MPPPNDGRSSTSVVIVGSHRVVYAGIEAWLNGSHPPIRIAGHFVSTTEFAAAYRTAAPDQVVLFDLPCAGGELDLDALRRICAAGHRVIVYTCSVTDDVLSAALDAGAVSCIAKSEPEHVLAAAIYAAHSDRPHVVPRMAQALPNNGRRPRPQLSQREQQVLVAWFQTDNKHAVAEKLYIEPSTVATHLQRVRAKYAAVGRPAPTKAALVARAIQDEILSVDDL
ncbi:MULTISPECIES: LuxR C-terminal-related transcriptional regulator [unclassified Mycobacterium]|uniref:LuxR C-terminal-related transcriptional regulator n=1 Tax=unclassified Mycobacterium TaxID=2642494 RepID=UPI0007405323|nr:MULTISPECIES: LuxR C-terminal-related transcriptional regulator [unclassified Mycobacterium]KUH86236.1 LuxR family transcriptional regulator [Mycobacterium sp. IS-1556]KUH86823.1 LuxR family transcriptional regulator [Mycobacterium sp. GA-0227b]KUH92099.1 LuxR family transcriptional regulator [Mycobacterium sp. GA-1999]